MNKTMRLQEIKKLVEERGRMEVNELSDRFQVSEVTIRNDLTVLEQRKSIRRIHGAALPIGESERIREESISTYVDYDIKKEEIGKISASLITDTGWVFIGQGTTCYYVAKELAKLKEVNVLTNNLLAAQALSKNKQANVIVTGGNLVHSHLYVAGEMFMRNLDKLYISKAFMGVGGADLEAGYTVNYSTELIVYQTIKEIADQLIIVVDSSKFNKTTFLSLGSLTFSDMVISDQAIPDSYKEYYAANGVKVLTE